VKNACQMLMVLGIDSRSVYEEDFEKPFLTQSAEFYRVRTVIVIVAYDANIAYVKFVEEVMYQSYLSICSFVNSKSYGCFLMKQRYT